MHKIPFLKGHFVWNSQTNELELLSDRDSGADGPERKRKSKSGPNIQHLHLTNISKDKNVLSKPLRGMLSPAGNPGITPRMTGQRRGSPRHLLHRNENATVMLDDVKHVAMEYLKRERLESGVLVSSSFRELVNKRQFDAFLISLLRYFNSIFEGLERNKHTRKTGYLEPSKAEIRSTEATRKKMTVIKRRLGQSYCALLLGIGLEKQHHMGCGKQRGSSTHKDKRMFEDVYWFCTNLIHITFRRRDFEKIRTELGDMLRSPIYNPATRNTRRIAADEEQISIGKPYVKDSNKPIGERLEKLLSVKLPQVDKMTPAEHRRQFGKRPAIKRAMHQRSSALISLLPLPQDTSDYLFKSTSHLRKQSIKQQEDVEELSNLYQHDFYHFERIGIIGEPLELFNPDTLMPKNMENDDDTDSRGTVSPAFLSTVVSSGGKCARITWNSWLSASKKH